MSGWRVQLSRALLVSVVACGPSPAPAFRPEAPPTGTLVIVIRQGPERVPFRPKLDRIRRANEQLAAILGHSLQIELDGSLLPQDHDGAEDVIVALVEAIAKDLAELKQYEPNALADANANFDRLVVRYSPAEAQERGRRPAKLDKPNKTIDVVVPEARWYALERGEIGTALVADSDATTRGRYENVLPDAVPAREHRAWFDFWRSHNSKQDSPNVIGPVDALRVRGMVMLTADGDKQLATDARKEIIGSELSNFSGAYHHHAEAIESAPADGPFHTAEKALVAWLNREAPTMTLEERDKVAQAIWVTDFRKNQGDRFATYSFPGFDPMAFSLATMDLWIQQGHPSEPRVFQDIVVPAHATTSNGESKYEGGCCDQWFYKWATVNPQRRDTFAQAILARRDPDFITTAFYNAHFVIREEADYLAFLRKFERSPAHWTTGAQIQRVDVYRPSGPLFEESKRWWRQVPIARGFALFYFARRAENSYHPDEDWDELLQDEKLTGTSLQAFLGLGPSAFQLLPTVWKGVGKSYFFTGVVLDYAKPMLAQSDKTAGRLAELARIACHEGALKDLDQLHRFAVAELPQRPGAGLSDVVEESDPAKCHPQPTHTRPPPNKKKAAPIPLKPGDW